jgi:hypothetical protein
LLACSPGRASCCVTAVLALSVATAACGVRLASPYDDAVYRGAQALETDFVRFAAAMQDVAGTPDGYYAKHRETYTDFAARLAVLQRRSESIPGGVPCGRALDLARRTGRSVVPQLAGRIAARAAEPGMEGASCTTVIVVLAQEQMERLRSQHELRCSRAAAEVPARCTTLFGAPPIYRIFATGTGDASSGTPLVSAVAITLDELVGIQEDVKPAPGA